MRRYLAGAVLVRLADEGSRVVLVLLALQRTGSATVGGLLVAAFVFPHVVAAPWAGLLIDRASHPHRFLATAAFCFASALALTALLIGHVVLGAVFAILVLGGCCGPVITGSVTSQLPALVDAARLPRAFALDALTYNVAGILGPTLGAIIAGIFSPVAALLSLAASAAIGGAIQATLPLGGRIIHPVGDGAHLANIVKVFRQRVLGLVTAASSMGQVGASSLPVFAAILATRHHHSAAAGYLMAAYASGGLTGALGWTLRPASARVAPYVVMVALIASGVPLAIAAGMHQLATTAVFFAMSGAFIGPMLGALFTSRQDEDRRTPARPGICRRRRGEDHRWGVRCGVGRFARASRYIEQLLDRRCMAAGCRLSRLRCVARPARTCEAGDAEGSLDHVARRRRLTTHARLGDHRPRRRRRSKMSRHPSPSRGMSLSMLNVSACAERTSSSSPARWPTCTTESRLTRCASATSGREPFLPWATTSTARGSVGE